EAGLRAGEYGGDEARENGRQDRQGRRQGELPEDRRSLSRQARQGARPARRQDQDADPGDQLGSSKRSSCPGRSAKRVFAPDDLGINVPAFASPTRTWM